MSRYELPPAAITNEAVHSIVVGWDRPLRTYFIQVHVVDPHRRGETRIILHEGCDLDHPVSMDALKALIAPYGSLPPDIEAAMRADQDKTISRVDTPHQAEMKAFLRAIRDEG